MTVLRDVIASEAKQAVRKGCHREEPRSGDVAISTMSTGLLRRFAPRNDSTARSHCERSEAGRAEGLSSRGAAQRRRCDLDNVDGIASSLRSSQ